MEEGKCRTDIPFVSSSPKLTARSLAPFSDKFPDRLAANRSTRQRDLITNCFALLLSPPSGRHRCERVEAITPRADLIAHCVVVVVTGDHSTSFRESGGHSLSRPYHNRPVKHAFVELALHHTTGFLVPPSLAPSLPPPLPFKDAHSVISPIEKEGGGEIEAGITSSWRR